MNEIGQVIVWTSLICVVLAGWYMWRLIQESGPIMPWILFGALCVLIIGRRVLTLVDLAGYDELSLTNEVILPSLISVVMLATAISLHRVFGNGTRRL